MKSDLRGMILAAGFGTRLRPLSYLRAKPAVPFLNRPLIQYSLELFEKVGIKETVINLHHLPESVKESVEQSSHTISFSHENEILGTGGGIGAVRHFMESSTFVVSNGKIYFDIDLQDALDFHWNSGSKATMILRPYSEEEPYNPVDMNSRNEIVGFSRSQRERAVSSSNCRPCVFSGIHIFEPEVFDLLPDGPSDIISALYEPLIDSDCPPRGFFTEGLWYESSTPVRYLENSLDLLGRLGFDCLSEVNHCCICKDSIIGRSCDVSPDCQIERCIVWDGVKIGPGNVLRNVILAGEALETPARFDCENALVLPRSALRPEQLAPNARIEDDLVIWPLGQ